LLFSIFVALILALTLCLQWVTRLLVRVIQDWQCGRCSDILARRQSVQLPLVGFRGTWWRCILCSLQAKRFSWHKLQQETSLHVQN